MRILRIILIILGIAGLIAWGVFYVWVIGMACAFGSVNTTNCRFYMPWELQGDDLMFLVVMPGGLVAAIFVLAWLIKPGKPPSE